MTAMHDPEKAPTTLRGRMAAALGVLVLSVAAAGALAASALATSERSLADVTAAERGIEAALRLSIALRDAYAHQAHVVILNDLTHLHHYDDAIEASRRALDAARARAPSSERQTLARLAAILDEIDRNFREDIVPRVPGTSTDFARPHDRALALLMEGQAHLDELAKRLEEKARLAHERADGARDGALVRVTAVFLAALVLALVVALYMFKTVARPLRTLALASRRLGHGELGTRIPVENDDELGALARRFNEMAAELEAREERMLDAERLAAVGKVAAGVAHEINNPLGVILGYARLVEKAGGQSAKDAAVIAQEVARCQEIVQGLLDLSRTPRLARSTVDLGELVAEVSERLKSAGVVDEVVLSLAPDAVVIADGAKLRQVMANLLKNASEAAPGQPVHVEVKSDGQRVVVSVSDRGAGVTPEVRAKLFEPFFTTKPKGTGLGLAVSASLARAHGGSLAIVDDDGGGGARFDLVLPRGEALAEVVP